MSSVSDDGLDGAAYTSIATLAQLATQLADHLSTSLTYLPSLGTLREWRPVILTAIRMAEKVDRSVAKVVYRKGVGGDHLRPAEFSWEPDMAIGTVYHHPDEGYTAVVWPHGAKPVGPFEDLDAVRMYLCVLLNSERGRWT